MSKCPLDLLNHHHHHLYRSRNKIQGKKKAIQGKKSNKHIGYYYYYDGHNFNKYYPNNSNNKKIHNDLGVEKKKLKIKNFHVRRQRRSFISPDFFYSEEKNHSTFFFSSNHLLKVTSNQKLERILGKKIRCILNIEWMNGEKKIQKLPERHFQNDDFFFFENLKFKIFFFFW